MPDHVLAELEQDYGMIHYSTVAPRFDFVPDLDGLLQAADDVQGVHA
jgi:hypothetical protein